MDKPEYCPYCNGSAVLNKVSTYKMDEFVFVVFYCWCGVCDAPFIIVESYGGDYDD